MKRSMAIMFLAAIILTFSPAAPVLAGYVFSDSFETPWTGDYSSPWTLEPYRHGTEPVAVMKQNTAIAHSGSASLQLEMKSVANSSMFWGAINANVNPTAMLKQYDPYMSVWYYDQGSPSASNSQTGQLYAVPSLVTGPLDWTDVQFGGRAGAYDNYYFTRIPGSWQNTGVARAAATPKWVNLEFQLSSTDGFIRFYIDSNYVGISDRNDYTDLGTAVLATMFLPPLSGYTTMPYAIFDDYQVGSNVPLPPSVLMLGSGLLGLVGLRWRRSRKES